MLSLKFRALRFLIEALKSGENTSYAIADWLEENGNISYANRIRSSAMYGTDREKFFTQMHVNFTIYGLPKTVLLTEYEFYHMPNIFPITYINIKYGDLKFFPNFNPRICPIIREHWKILKEHNLIKDFYLDSDELRIIRSNCYIFLKSLQEPTDEDYYNEFIKERILWN